jgi:hypothetical protein
MKTPEQIKRQIEGLEKMKLWLPPYSKFGDPNHEIINAQVSILDGTNELDDIEEGDWDEMDEDNKIFRGAEEAVNWLEEDDAEDLFEEK